MRSVNRIDDDISRTNSCASEYNNKRESDRKGEFLCDIVLEKFAMNVAW